MSATSTIAVTQGDTPAMRVRFISGAKVMPIRTAAVTGMHDRTAEIQGCDQQDAEDPDGRHLRR